MSDVASLVIAVDSTSADNAVRSLQELAKQGGVTETSLKKTGESGNGLRKVGKEADTAARSMGLLAAAAHGFVAAISVREIVQIADGYTQLTAQLRLATRSNEEYGQAFDSVRRIAKTAQADLSATAVLYSRIANGTRDLALSQQKIADITETVNLALKVSGASAGEASSAMLQLSQAFGAGVLRGEELNAVMESAPRLIQAIAEGMGVSTGAIRAMAAEGKITAEVLSDVLPAALGALREEAKHVETIGGSFTSLKNAVLELVGTQAQATGFNSAMSGGLNLLANNLNTVVSIAGTLAAAKLAGTMYGIAKSLLDVGASAATASRGLALIGGPVGILTAALVGGAFAWNSYKDSVNATRKALTDVDAPVDQLIAKFNELSRLEQQSALRGLAEAVKQAEVDLAEAFDSLAKVPLRLRNSPAIAQFKKEIEGLKGADLGAAELDEQVTRLVDAFKAANPHAKSAYEAIDRLGIAVIDAARKGDKLVQTQQAVTESTKGVVDQFDRAAVAAAKLRAGLDTKEWDTFIARAQTAATTVGMSAQQLGEFQARALGASEAQAQLAGVLSGMADAARDLEKATADKDSKAQTGAKTLIAALAQQEVQLRVNIKAAQEYARLMALGIGQTDASRFSTGIAEGARAEYEKEVTERLKALFKNIESNTGISKSVASAAEKATKAIDDQIKALQLQAATVGMAEEQVTLYKLATEGATKAQLAGAKAALDAKRAGELSLAVAKKRVDTSNEAIRSLVDETRRNQDLAETFGMSASAIEQVTIARLHDDLARKESAGADQEEIDRLKMLIELRTQNAGALSSVEWQEAEKKRWEAWSNDVEKIFGQVGQSLTDAIFDGGKSGRELVKDLFKTLTLRVFIEPAMKGMQGWVTNEIGGLLGYTNPQQQGGVGGMLQNANSLNSIFGAGYQALTGASAGASTASLGYANMVGAMGGDSIGALIAANGGWEGALSGLGSAAGASLAAGIGAVAPSVAASLGATIGTSSAAMASTTFAASLGGAGAAGAAGGAAAAGGMGAAMGALGTALPYLGIGLAAASAFGIFDSGPPKTRHGQRTTVDYRGGAFGLSGVDDRQAAGAEQAALAAAESTVKAANELFARIGVNAGIESFYAIMESSVLGDRDGVASGGSLRVGDQMRQIGVKQSSDMTLAGFGGWSSAEMLPRLQTDIQLSVLEAFQAVGDELPSVLGDMLEGVYVRGLDGPAAQELASRFAAVADGATQFLAAIETLPFAQLKGLSFDAAAGLVAAAGGFENLTGNLNTYYDNFYTDAEKVANASGQVGKAFSDLGYTMPDLTLGADAAKLAFRGMVESLDLTTEEGARMFAALTGLSGGFAQLITAFDELNSASSTMARTQADILRERLGLESRVMQLTGDTAGLRQRELDALDASNQPLQERIWALEQEAAIAAQRGGLENELLQLQGNTVEIRRRELAGLDESNHALQIHIWMLEAQANAASKAADTLRSALDAVVQSGQAQIAELQKSFGGTDSAMSAFRSMSQSIQNELTSIINTIDKSISELRGNVDDAFGAQYDKARAVIGTALVTRQLPQTADLSEALRVAQQGVMGQQYGSKFEQDRAYLTLANEMEALKGIAEPELDAAKATLAQLEEQYSLLRGTNRIAGDSLKTLEDQLRAALNTEASARVQISGIEAQIELARSQYNTLLEIRDGVLAFPDALAAFASAAAAVRPTGPSGGGGGGGGWDAGSYYANNPDVAAAYESYGKSYGHTPESWAKEHYDDYGKYEGRKFARGGLALPGWAMVGEEGPELVNFSQPGRVYTAGQTNDILRNMGAGQGGGNADVVAELRALREQNGRLEMRLASIEKSSGQLADQFDNVTAGGNAMATEEMTA